MTTAPSKASHITDNKQSWWQLSCIQLSGWMSLPTIATSICILEKNSFLGSVLTIIVGNGLLWFIRFAIVALSYKDRSSTLDLSEKIFGSLGSKIVALILLLSTFAWFFTQTNSASKALTSLININENSSIDKFTQISVLLGIMSAFLCAEGIKVLKWLSLTTLPILFILLLLVLYLLPSSSVFSINADKQLSLTGLTLIVSTNLGFSADLPTFFRHSRRFEDSVLALTVVQLISIALGIISLFFYPIVNSQFEIVTGNVLALSIPTVKYCLIALIFISVVCANVANVYSASVGWEVLAPKSLVGRKEYLILGLSLTILFIFFENILFINPLLIVTDLFLANLSILFFGSYFILHYTKYIDSLSFRIFSLSTWIFICILSMTAQIFNKIELISPIFFSIVLIIISLSIFIKARRSFLIRK